MTATVKAAFKDITAAQLVMWERPIASGTTLAAILASVFFLSYADYTLTTAICRIVQILFVVGGALIRVIAISANDRNHIRALKNWWSDIGPLAILAFSPTVVRGVEAFFSLIIWEDAVASLKVFGATIILAFAGNIFSDLQLLTIATILAFSVPIVYTKNQAKIDPLLKQVTDQVNDVLAKVKAAIPKKDTKTE